MEPTPTAAGPVPDPYELRIREMIAQGDGEGIVQIALTDRAEKTQEIMNYSELLKQAQSRLTLLSLDVKSKASLLPKPEFFFGIDSKPPSVHQWLFQL